MSTELKEAKRKQRQAERRWWSRGLTVHRDVYVKERSKVHALHIAAKRQHFDTLIRDCTTSKELNAVSYQLMGNIRVPVLPTNISPSDLPEAFSKFFSDKIKTIRYELDAFPADNDDISFEGAHMACFRPVSEETVRDLVLKSQTKSCILDPVPTELLKSCIDDPVPLITRIVNDSLESGTVDVSLKQAIVTLFK